MSDVAPKYLDDVVGTKPKYLDDIFGPQGQSEPTVWDGAHSDEYFATSSPGRWLDAFGVGAKKGWGEAAAPISPQAEAWYRSVGLTADSETGNQNLLHRFNEQLLRTTAASTDLFMRSGSALYMGAAEALTQGLEGEDPNNPLAGFARDIAAMPQAFMGEMGGFLPHQRALRDAHDLKLTEEGSPGVTPREGVTRFAPTGVESPTERVIVPGGISVEEVPPPAPEAPINDVHTLARQNAPEVFAEYDPLTDQHAALSVRLEELGRERDAELQSRIDNILDKVGGVESRLTNSALRRLARAREEFDNFSRRDTPEMAVVRADRETVDARMRDLAPDVSAAYRAARDALPPAEPTIEPAPAAEPLATPQLGNGLRVAARDPDGTIHIGQPGQIHADLVPNSAKADMGFIDANGKYLTREEALKTLEPEQRQGLKVQDSLDAADYELNVKKSAEIYNLLQRRPTIAADVTRQLVSAGRPAEEARASAALVQAHYEARAARFNGALGSARDLYEAEDPIIARGEGRARGQLDLVRNQITLFKDADASTFVHETAHQWLEEIQRDATHERAPPDLIADMQTVRDWLGAEREITRAQHEKFARGFERYLMEGVAPSSRLAQVFAKFADWLKQLYQTVGRLRAPINDSIRGVYDRLLSSPKQEPVIAPEREVALSYAGQHERDLATTSPVDAPKVAEQMAAEREQIAQIMRAEIMNGRRRARATARAAGRGTEEGASGTGILPEPRSTEVATIRENTASEPTAVSPSGATASVKSSIPEGVHDEILPGESKLVGKSGEFRLDNVETPDDVDTAIREKIERAGGDQGGAPTTGQLIDLSDAIGTAPWTLDRNAISEAFTAKQVEAGMQFLKESEVAVRDAMEKVANGGDPMELALAISRLEMIQGKLSQTASEWGRAGQAFRTLKEYTGGDLATLLRNTDNPMGRSYDQLMQLAILGQKMKTPGQVGNLIGNTRNTVHPIVFYYWNSLISGPLTHSVYFAGNMIRAVGEPLLEVPIAATIGAAMRTDERVYFREVGASLYGLVKGFKDSLPMARDAFILGQQIPLPGQRGYGNAFGNFANPIPGALGTAIGLPGRSISAIHQLGMGIRYEQALQRLAVRDGIAKGLDGDALDINTARLTQYPSEAMMEEAGQKALTEMYMRPSQYGEVANALSAMAHKTVVGQVLFPFIKIGVELQRETFVKHTLVGLADKEVRNQLLMREGGAAFGEAAAKQMLGIGFLGLGAYLSQQEQITGYGPSEPGQRTEWLLNHQPFSVRIGNLWVPYAGLGPFGKLLQFGAESYEAAHFWDGEESSKLAKNYFSAIHHAVFDESLFRSADDLVKAVDEPLTYGTRWLYNFAGGWVPYSAALGQLNRQFIDTHSKDVQNIFDGIRARVPFWSFRVPDRYDAFGNTIKTRGINVDQYANDPVVAYLDKLGAKIAKPEKDIRGIKLTQDQYGDYSRQAGVMARQMLENFVNDPRATSAPRGVQLLEINRWLDAARKIARTNVIMQSAGTSNDILQKARELKLKIFE